MAGANAFGLPDLRMVLLKHPVNTLNPKQVTDLLGGALSEIVRKLTEG